MSYHEGSNWQAKKEDEGKPLYNNKKDRELFEKMVNRKLSPNKQAQTLTDVKYEKGEKVLHYPNTEHKKEVTYLSEFMFKGEKWYNIQLENGGFMETQFISKK